MFHSYIYVTNDSFLLYNFNIHTNMDKYFLGINIKKSFKI